MEKKQLVIFTGAGVSAESGIQTFRDSDGLWYGYDFKEVASVAGWKKDKAKVLDFYNKRRRDAESVLPNKCHKMIASLEEHFNVTVITQNVDDLHERAGSTNVLHLHGQLNKMCSSMNKNATLPYDKDINVGDKHPDGSQLRPFIVWFGEDVPNMLAAYAHTATADIFVVIGTSLSVYPAANLVDVIDDDVHSFVLDKSTPEVPENFICIEKTAVQGAEDLYNSLLELK